MAGQGGRKPVDYKNYGRRTIRRNKPKRQTRGGLWLVLALALLTGALFWWWPAPEQESATNGAVPAPTLPQERERKQILDRQLVTMAASFPVYAAYVKPLELANVAQAAAAIARVLELDAAALQKRFASQRTYVWLGRHIPVAQAEQLVSLDLTGLYLRKSAVHFYPHYNSAAQVVGYVQDNHGLSGAELYYDRELLGSAETVVPPGERGGEKVTSRHLVLTLDLRVQTLLEKQMALLAAQTKATSVSALVVHPANGAILAYAQTPSFDPNLFWEAESRNQKVKMITTPLHPGAISALFRFGAALHAHEEVAMPFSESSGRIILPRARKKGSTSQGGHWWNWPKGGYISSELAELPDPSVNDEQLLSFQNALGISCADGIDLPEKVEALRRSDQCGQGSLNGISLLGGFCRLVNGGEPVQLHVRRGSLDDDGSFEPVHYERKGAPIPEVSAKVRAALQEAAGAQARFLAVEYLQPLQAEEMIVTDEAALESDEESGRFDGVLLATDSADVPQMAMLVAVENGRFEKRDASPMRRWVGRFFDGVQRENLLADLEKVPGSMPQDNGKMYALWLREMRKAETGKGTSVTSGAAIMPDLRGRSLRKALTLIQPLGVEVDIRGAGRVVSQQPAAGSEVVGRLVELTLGHGTGKQKEDRHESR